MTHRGSREALLGKNPSAEAIAQYSNEQHVTAKTPPALLFHSDDDTVVPSMNSVVFYQALKKNKVPAVLYIFDKGGHGWGMRNNFEYHNQWTNLLAIGEKDLSPEILNCRVGGESPLAFISIVYCVTKTDLLRYIAIHK